MIRRAPPQPPTDCETKEESVIRQKMPHTQALCPRAAIERPPIHKTEERRNHAADNSGCDEPVGDVRPIRIIANRINNVAGDACWQQTRAASQRQHRRRPSPARRVRFTRPPSNGCASRCWTAWEPPTTAANGPRRGATLTIPRRSPPPRRAYRRSLGQGRRGPACYPAPAR